MFTLQESARANRSPIGEGDLQFLKSIVTSLPASCQYLLDQLNEGFILFLSEHPYESRGYHYIVYDSKLETRYWKQKADCVIEGVKVFTKWGACKSMSLEIVNGILVNFFLHGNHKDVDLNKIDTSEIVEKYYEDGEELYRSLIDLPLERSKLVG